MKSRFRQLHKKFIFTLAIAFLVLPLTTFAQATSSEIRGVVTDTSGNVIQNASVNVRNEQTGLER